MILTYGSRGDVQPFVALANGSQERAYMPRKEIIFPQLFKVEMSYNY
jgi:hypothetical protein